MCLTNGLKAMRCLGCLKMLASRFLLYELFDVLDADLSGVLNLQELVEGLMRLRGPVSKNDMVAVRLKVEYLTHVIVDMSHKVNRMSSAYSKLQGDELTDQI